MVSTCIDMILAMFMAICFISPWRRVLWVKVGLGPMTNKPSPPKRSFKGRASDVEPVPKSGRKAVICGGCRK